MPLLPSQYLFAIAITVTVARAGPSPLPSVEITASLGGSKRYQEPLVQGLSRAGILAARRGRKGGYTLARRPQFITCWDILRATDVYDEPPSNPMMLKLAESIEAEFVSQLQITTVAMLMERMDLLGSSPSARFQIR